MPVPAGLSVTAGVHEKMSAQQYCVVINRFAGNRFPHVDADRRITVSISE